MSYYDAMPVSWKKMNAETDCTVVCIIDKVIAEAPFGTFSWAVKANVLKLVPYCNLDDILRMQICHVVAKKGPGVVLFWKRLIVVDNYDFE